MSGLDYFNSPSELYKCIEDGDEASAISRVKEAPEEAKKWIIRKSKDDGSIVWRRLPIHEACIRHPSEALIDSLVKAYSIGLKEVDAVGRLPLHHACIHGASEAVVLKMVMASPESITVQDSWGKTPLFVTETSTNSNKNKIQNILSKGVGFYFRKIMEIEKNNMIMEEKKNSEEKLKKMKEKYLSKIDAMELSSRENENALEEKIKVFCDDINNLKSELNDSKEKLKKSRAMITQLKDNETITEEKHKAKLSEMARKLIDKTELSMKDAQTIMKLNEIINEVKNEQSLLQSQLSKSNERNEMDTMKIINLKKDIDEINDERDFYQVQLSQLMKLDSEESSSLVDSLSGKVVKLSNELKSIGNENNELKGKVNELQDLSNVLSSLDSPIKAIDSNHDSIISELEKHKTELMLLDLNYVEGPHFVQKAQDGIMLLRQEISLAMEKLL